MVVTWRRTLFSSVTWVCLHLVRSFLILFGYRRVYREMSRCSPVPGNRVDIPLCRTNARLVDRVALRRMALPATCLHRSLTLWWLLRFQGLETQIRTGVRRKDPEGWDLHAWVEHNGIIINDDPDVIATYSLMPDMLATADASAGRYR